MKRKGNLDGNEGGSHGRPAEDWFLSENRSLNLKNSKVVNPYYKGGKY